MHKIALFLLKLHGWTIYPASFPPATLRSVMIAAPHTSNWDFYYMMLTFIALKVPVRFTIKESWTRFPFGLITKPLGAIGIDRTPKTPGGKRPSYVEGMIDIFNKNEKMVVVVTPEGTRSLRTQWKRGFYFTAIGAKVPITFGYLDYKLKRAGVGGMLHPTGNVEADFKVINDFYKDIHPKYTDKWSLDERYL